MKILRVSSFLFFCFLITLTSQEIGSWKSYNSMNDVIDIASHGGLIWSATTGGAFFFDSANETIGKLSPSDGLSSPLLNSVDVDRNGKVWFGTQRGNEQGMINAFNPSDGTVKRISDILDSDFSQKNINDLFTYGDTLFVSTDFGLSLIDINSYTFYDTFIKFGDFPALSGVNSAFINEKIYVVTNNGLAVQKSVGINLSAPESWITYKLGSDIEATENYTAVLYNSVLYLGTDNGLFKLSGDQWVQSELPSSKVTKFQVIGDKLYILANQSGTDKIYSYDGTQAELIFGNSDGYSVRAIEISSSGIFAATSEGLLLISGEETESIVPDGPKNNSFVSMDVDNDGTLWVATGNDVFGVGIYEFDGTNWRIFDNSNTDGITSNAFHIAYAAPDNTKYFGNWGRAFSAISSESFTNYYSTELPITGIPNDPNFIVINGFGADSKGNVWLLNLQSASAEPLSVMTPDNEFINYNITNPTITANDVLKHLIVDQYDTKWFVVTIGSTGLYYFNENGTLENTSDDVMGRVRRSDGLDSDAISALALDKRGNLWVGTNVGVNIIPDPSRPTSNILRSFALRQQSVNCIEVDALNRKWVGTLQGVFLMSEDGTFLLEHYNTSNSPIPTNDIRSIAVNDRDGTVYVGTDLGLTSLKTNSVKPVESFDELFVYPNPVKIKGRSNVNITIDGLVEDSQIKILSITGELVRQIVSPGGKIAFWDGKDESGNFVSSGVYLIVAYDEEGSNVSTSKVAIVRE